MIELKVSQLRDEKVIASLRKLMHATGLSFAEKFTLLKLSKEVDKEISHSSDIFNEMIKKIAETTPNTEGGTDWKIPDDKREEWTKLTKDFAETKVQIDRPLLKQSLLEKIELSAADLVQLESFIEPLDV